MTKCETCTFANILENRVLETDYWRVDLDPDQEYLGKCFVALKQHKPRLSALSIEEQQDFFNVVRLLEGFIGRAFAPNYFNWYCLMNDTHKDSEPNPHVHFHCIPRYKEEVYVKNAKFQDSRYGESARSITPNIVTEDIRLEIIESIRASLTT